VLGRRVEKMVLSAILEHARARGIQRLIGTYRPTERNKLVENHYSELGFAEVPRRADGTTIWELSVNTAVVESAPMAVRSFGFETLHEI
jgi:predicted enzyme involved in methoxymalonyl-ACP biosynthesis